MHGTCIVQNERGCAHAGPLHGTLDPVGVSCGGLELTLAAPSCDHGLRPGPADLLPEFLLQWMHMCLRREGRERGVEWEGAWGGDG